MLIIKGKQLINFRGKRMKCDYYKTQLCGNFEHCIDCDISKPKAIKKSKLQIAVEKARGCPPPSTPKRGYA